MTFQSALGIAHYRLGRFQKEHYQQALAHLAKGAQDYAPTLAVLAMTQFNSARRSKVSPLLPVSGNSCKPWTGQGQESQAFLAEAEARSATEIARTNPMDSDLIGATGAVWPKWSPPISRDNAQARHGLS